MIQVARPTSAGTVFGCSSLDPPETNGQTPVPRGAGNAPSRYSFTAAQTAIHARYNKSRTQILDALDDSTFAPVAKQRARIAMCCYAPLFVATDAGTVAVAPGFCRQRMCPTCQARRGRELSARVHAITGTMDAPRFLTLTLRSADDTLKGQLDRLYAAFKELRRTQFWKAHVRGGCAVAEVTRNPQSGLWHPHLHVLTDGSFMPQKALADAWEAVTRDSRIVDIRAVHDRQTAARYIAAYVAKPTTVADWPDHAVNEFAYALHGRRLLITFGSCHRVKVPTDECETRPAIVEPLCSTSALNKSLARGCVVAQHAHDLLRRIGGMVRLTLGPSISHPQFQPPPLEPWEHQHLIDALRWIARFADSRGDDTCPFDIDTVTPQTQPSTARAHVRLPT